MNFSVFLTLLPRHNWGNLSYQYFALPTPHSVAAEVNDNRDILNANFPDSLEVNAIVKESRNPGSILPLITQFLCCFLQLSWA